MIRLGDKLTGIYPSTFTGEDRGRVPVPARVVWLPPLARFVVVEFTFPGGSFRECWRLKRRKGRD